MKNSQKKNTLYVTPVYTAGGTSGGPALFGCALRLGFYKLMFYVEAFVHESIVLCQPPPPYLHCPHYCNTITRLLRNIRRPPDLPCVCHTPYTMGNSNIV